MNVLVVGSGGREHAIIRKLALCKQKPVLYCAPGNAGISYDAQCVNIAATDIEKMVSWAVENSIKYAVVAPDDPLVLGMVDAFNEKGIPCFGPNKAAAIIEGSKVFSKNLMKKYNIPTADYNVFDNAKAAVNFLNTNNTYPVVVKADGLALGKGVLICDDKNSAIDAVNEIMTDKKFGSAGNNIVIEEFLQGPEVSVLAFTDGKTVVPMVSSMDHKRAYNDDKGLNTGGMGTIAPNPFYTQAIAQKCMETIFIPTINAMQSEGRTFKGCLYFGLMLTKNGAKVIEYNCRFGDPETQVVLPLLKSDLLDVMISCTNGTLADTSVEFEQKSAACVVLASGGYPQNYEKGKQIYGLENGQPVCDDTCVNVQVFHAGTAFNGEGEHSTIVTAGGRVLGVTAVEDNLQNAVNTAYKACQNINFENCHKRTDIGQKALNAL